ncbi:MAG: hypothetical protein M1155_00165 [Patescibacteria group bacterium]|nr:hypothetical protein [Patescibacteria group bacterium]
MMRLIFIVFTNLFIGSALSMLRDTPLSTTAALSIGAAFIILAILLTGMSLLMKKDELKKARKVIKEGEVYHVLSQFTAREAGSSGGVIGAVRNNKTKKLEFLIFDKELPPIFKKEDGELVPYQ